MLMPGCRLMDVILGSVLFYMLEMCNLKVTQTI